MARKKKAQIKTTSQIAQIWGVSSKTIIDWRKKWLAPAYLKYGSFDMVVAHRLYIENIIAPQFECNEESGSITESKRKKEKALAEKAQLQVKGLRESLVHRSQPLEWIGELVAEAKKVFRGIPRKIAPGIYGKEIREIEGIIEDEIKAALRKLARPESSNHA
ncbi:MAG: hypothetical protein HQM08_29265 [Candidatus Riflebacteria bacterium]|nr:hypothetical protein [Candidatus Riflebacteria bacterium]